MGIDDTTVVCSNRSSVGGKSTWVKLSLSLISLLSSAYWSHAEIVLPENPGVVSTEAGIGPAQPNPIKACTDITQSTLNGRFLSKFKEFAVSKAGIDIEIFSTRPDLLTIEECNDILVISTVNSIETSGSTLRFFFPIRSKNREDLLQGNFENFVFLLN